MAPTRSLIVATCVLVLAGGVSVLAFEPAEVHTSMTCALLLVGAAIVAPRRDPRWFPSRGRLVLAGPLVLATGLFAASLVTLLYLLGVPPVLTSPSLHGVMLVTLVPLAEEAFFRGALLRIAPGHRVLSVVASAVAFGLLHVQLGWPMVGWMTVAGTALGVVAVVSRGLALPLVLHAAFNGLAVGYQEQAPIGVALPVVVAAGLSLGGWWRAPR